MSLQVGDRTLLADLFQIVSERGDTKFKFLSISPNIYLSGPEATALAQAGSGKALDPRDYSRAGRPKGTQFMHAKVGWLRQLEVQSLILRCAMRKLQCTVACQSSLLCINVDLNSKRPTSVYCNCANVSITKSSFFGSAFNFADC